MPFVLFGFGLIIGSFLNALIHRLHSGQSILEQSSKCPQCNHKLTTWDLIPVVSFFILAGRCRYCHQAISWQYPVVELTTGIIFVIIPAQAGIQSSLVNVIFQLIFACFFIVIFVYDLKHYLILDKVLIPGVILAIVYDLLIGKIWFAVLGASMLAGFFLLLFFVSRGRWIGAGDIKLGVLLGLLVPFPETLILFFAAYFTGALVSMGLLVLGGKRWGDRLPFGTFLTFGAFIGMLWGEELVNWYFRLIGIT